MSSLFGVNKPNTNLRKNVFDLSEKTLFSQSAGMLVPCFQRELNPGEKVQLDMSMFVRTQPLNTAAYVRCKQYVHAFFVPYKQLWRGWDNFFYGVDYRISTLQPKAEADGTTKYSMVPRFDLMNIIAGLIEDGLLIEGYGNSSTSSQAQSGKAYNDELGYKHFRGISRLLDMLGYGFLTAPSSGSTEVYKQISTLSDLIDEFISNLDAIKNAARTEAPVSRSQFPSRDDDRYENYLRRKEKERLDAVKASAGKIRELVSSLKSMQFSVNPFRFLAYQKIYSDFYKRDDYEATYPEHFNIDDLSGDFIVTGDNMSRTRLLNMLRIRYRWLPKDYFTGVVPSELFGTDKDIQRLFRDTVISNDFFLESGGSELAFSTSDGVSTKTIRAAFAIEKHLRLTRRAGGFDYISQTAAHFGFEPPRGRGEKVEFLGGYSGMINISEVVTTANGHLKGSGNEVENAAVGQIFGKGVGSVDGKSIEFTAKEHGILMCISSVVPELDYSSVGLNRFNAKFQRGDYFQPEFQDLGLQPVYAYELKKYLKDASNIADTSILGFAPRYAEYKTAYDTLHGEFRNGRSMSAWSADSLVDYDTSNSRSGLRINTLKINPKCLDRIMSVVYNGSEDTDQFMVQGQFVCKVIRPMSITGQGL